MASVKVDAKLHLVIPVEQPTGILYVHSAPVSLDIFRRYVNEISRTFASIIGLGLGEVAGPRVAAMMLEDISKKMGTWDREGGVRDGLMAEIFRRTNVAVPRSGGGWDRVPYLEAKESARLDEEDQSEIENAIVFFIVGSAMTTRSARRTWLEGGASLWGGFITSSIVTEFIASLTTSTEAESSGEKPTTAGSSLPR